MSINRLCLLLATVVLFFSIEVSSLIKKLYLRSEINYNSTINNFCPNELDDNYAGKDGLYFNSSNMDIKISLLKKYFNHCGAWCLFDYRDPRKGWYWEQDIREWKYYVDLYKICPTEEFHFSLNKFLYERIYI
jgi:hypothetical protein